MVSLQAQSVSMVKMIALTGHPEIAKARLRYAKMPSGEKDRTAMDTALGLLPQPRGGSTIINKAIFGSNGDTMRQQKALQRHHDDDGPDDNDDSPDDEGYPASQSGIDLNRLFPPCSIMQEKLVAIRAKLLPEDTDKKIQ
jgi:hypothetical protein